MDLDLTNKVIIVTGGAKGIGKGMSKLLALEGAISVIIGRDETDNNEVVKEILDEGGKSFGIVAELTNPEECKKGIQSVLHRYKKIDGLVNNAGENDGVGLEKGLLRKVHAITPKKCSSLVFNGPHWRQIINEKGRTSIIKKWSMKGMAFVLSRPKWYRFSGRIGRKLMKAIPGLFKSKKLNPWFKGRQMPEVPTESFGEWYGKTRTNDQ